MTALIFDHCRPRIWISFTALLCILLAASPASATDYFLTIGGGYNRTGNQASLEANVVFFQQVLTERHRRPRRHEIYFADGHDPAADLQIVVPRPAKSTTPASDLIAALHRRGPADLDVSYRNHQVPQIAGRLEPELIRKSLEGLGNAARQGDRLIIYVTAHGSEGPENDDFNTTIDCWNERKITAREFEGWLDKLPGHLPVVMVMAQCYCGGFARTIYNDLNQSKGLTSHLRVGFFAQQHDLPAAGCRPDIEHDEEFSSYFWGALATRSRNGVPIRDSDIDRNGVLSFAEAYAHAVIAGETIDIPLRTSEVLLRDLSRLTPMETKPATKTTPDPAAAAASESNKATGAEPPSARQEPALHTLKGSLATLASQGRPVSSHIVTKLSQNLGFQPQDDVQKVLNAFQDHRRAGRPMGPGGRRQGSGRRELLKEVAEKWPELGDPKEWKKSALLKAENQEKLYTELRELPGWQMYEERQKQRATASKAAETHELKAVKFRRLINTMECIVLEQNLPLVAKPEIVTRYQQILALEESALGSP